MSACPRCRSVAVDDRQAHVEDGTLAVDVMTPFPPVKPTHWAVAPRLASAAR
jgi:hypothetical protein